MVLRGVDALGRRITELTTNVHSLGRNLHSLGRNVSKVSFVNECPWAAMSNTTAGTAGDVRKKFLTYGGYPRDGLLVCALTGQPTPRDRVKVAHILPRSTKSDVLGRMSITDVNDNRNLLLLSDNIEKAFDAMRVSFVRDESSPIVYRLQLRVWDASVREVPVYAGAQMTIGACEGNVLNLRLPSGDVHDAFKRCLSFHTLMCFVKHNVLSGTAAEEPRDFDSSVYPEHDTFSDWKMAYLRQCRDAGVGDEAGDGGGVTEYAESDDDER